MANWWEDQFEPIRTDWLAFLMQGEPVAIVLLLVVILFGYPTWIGIRVVWEHFRDRRRTGPYDRLRRSRGLAYGVYANPFFSVQITYRNALGLASDTSPSPSRRPRHSADSPDPEVPLTVPLLCPWSASEITFSIPAARQASLKVCLNEWNVLRLSVILRRTRRFRPPPGQALPRGRRRPRGQPRRTPRLLSLQTGKDPDWQRP